MSIPIHVPEAGLIIHPFEIKLTRVLFDGFGPGRVDLEFQVIDRNTRCTETRIGFTKPFPYNPLPHGNMLQENAELIRRAMREFCAHEVDECIADGRDGRLMNDPHGPGYCEHGPSYR